MTVWYESIRESLQHSVVICFFMLTISSMFLFKLDRFTGIKFFMTRATRVSIVKSFFLTIGMFFVVSPEHPVLTTGVLILIACLTAVVILPRETPNSRE